jgi:hypothetical protein
MQILKDLNIHTYSTFYNETTIFFSPAGSVRQVEDRVFPLLFPSKSLFPPVNTIHNSKAFISITFNFTLLASVIATRVTLGQATSFNTSFSASSYKLQHMNCENSCVKLWLSKVYFLFLDRKSDSDSGRPEFYKSNSIFF